MVRGTVPEESQHPPLCPSPSCLLPPPKKPRAQAQPAPLPSPGTCRFPGRAAPRPPLRQGGGRGLSARPWAPGCCHRLLKLTLTGRRGKSWCREAAQPHKSPHTAHGFLAGRASGCRARRPCHPNRHGAASVPRDAAGVPQPGGSQAEGPCL